MLASISPLGERARGNRWGLTAGAYGAAQVMAASVLGAGMGALGALADPRGAWRLPLAAGLAAAAGALDLLAPGRVPTVHRQVDERWLARYRGWVYGAGFGAQLGLGVVTIVSTATVYAWVAAAALGGSATGGALVGAAFGTARTLPLMAVARTHTPADLRGVLWRLTSLAGPGRAAAAGASVAVGAGWLAAAAVGRL